MNIVEGNKCGMSKINSLSYIAEVVEVQSENNLKFQSSSA